MLGAMTHPSRALNLDIKQSFFMPKSDITFICFFLINIHIYIYEYLLKTELRILDFQHFHWLAGHRLSAHIPALPNMVNESINKESWIKIFPRNWRPLKIV